MTSPPLAPRLPSGRRAFRALAITIVPGAARLDAEAWMDVEGRIEAALRMRSPRLRRQLRLLILALEWGPLLRHRRRFSNLDAAHRAQILDRMQRSSTLLLRRGFWGLRTLVFLGYYGRPEIRRSIGYRAEPGGWAALMGDLPNESSEPPNESGHGVGGGP
ncbi:MAG: hypothetical protein P8Y10_07180 [Gemmatimonadales bacterium]